MHCLSKVMHAYLKGPLEHVELSWLSLRLLSPLGAIPKSVVCDTLGEDGE